MLALRFAYRAVCQINSLRRVNSIRPPDARIAPRAMAARYGKVTRSRAVCANWRPSDFAAVSRCTTHGRSLGLRTRSSSTVHSTGATRSASTNRVQKPDGSGASVQLPTSSSSCAGGTRLRRRLSKPFHHASADSVLGRRFPPGPGTLGRSQPAICQSPLIQRWRRLISTAKLAGWSSYSSTSVTNADRAKALSTRSWLRMRFSGKRPSVARRKASTSYMPLPTYDPSANTSWYTSDTSRVYGSMPASPALSRAKRERPAAGRLIGVRGCRMA